MEEQSNKSLLDEIKSDLEELEVQLNLGKKEFKSAFEKKRKEFSATMQKFHSDLSEYEKKGSGKIQKLKEKSADLLDTLESNFDFSYTDYSEKPHNLKTALEDFEHGLKEYYKEVEGKSMEVKKIAGHEIDEGIGKFKKELEVQQAYLKHLTEKSKTEWEEWKQKKLEEVQDLKGKIEGKVASSKEKAGKFNEDVAEAYRHLRTAFKNLK